jgi:uncharacterized protein YcaQ
LLQKIIELSSPTSNAITNSNEERIGWWGWDGRKWKIMNLNKFFMAYEIETITRMVRNVGGQKSQAVPK